MFVVKAREFGRAQQKNSTETSLSLPYVFIFVDGLVGPCVVFNSLLELLDRLCRWDALETSKTKRISRS
jgi:hypothetical protein